MRTIDSTHTRLVARDRVEEKVLRPDVHTQPGAESREKP